MPTNHNGDCIETMNAMPPESVDAGYATAPIVVISRGTWAGYRPDRIEELKEHA